MTYAFLLDLGRCIGCQACVAACKTGNELAIGTQYIRITEQTRGTFPNLQGSFQNQRCYHCADAACVAVCPTGALFKEDGFTRVNAAACSGCEYCVTACPFEIPHMVDKQVSKCDGCADVVKAGGRPWCVKTCPSHALMYGEREAIIAEAHRRADALRGRYPNANVYGETESGGLGVIMVLPDTAETLDFPVDPQTKPITKVWQKAVQPASVGLSGLGVLVTGIAAVIARRNHVKEMERLHKQAAEQAAEERIVEEGES